MRLVDSTLVKEPGATGSQYRVLYSLRVPDWQCDYFRLSSAKGAGNGESLKHFAIRAGDCLLADRGFSHLAGLYRRSSEAGRAQADVPIVARTADHPLRPPTSWVHQRTNVSRHCRRTTRSHPGVR